MFGLFPICCLLIILIVSILRGPSFPENYFVIMPQVLPREKKRHEYHEAIKKRYRHLPEVNRIARWFDQSNYFWEPHMAANIYIISYMFCKTIIVLCLLFSILGFCSTGIGTYQGQYTKLLLWCALWLMLGKERKRGGKFTVPQGVLQHSHCGGEELSKKLSEVFLSWCLLKMQQIFMSCQEFLYFPDLPSPSADFLGNWVYFR